MGRDLRQRLRERGDGLSKEMTKQAREALRAYKRDYNARNREKINEQHRTWEKNNPDKVKAIRARYWAKKAKKMNIE